MMLGGGPHIAGTPLASSKRVDTPTPKPGRSWTKPTMASTTARMRRWCKIISKQILNMSTKKNQVETPEQKAYREMVEKIAGNIATLSKAVVAMLNGPLKKKAIVRLLASSSGHPIQTVEQVIGALETMEADWLNKK